MYTYRKPKNAVHAIELVKLANAKVLWDICNPAQLENSQKYFEMYQPIVFVYKNDELIAAAHGKSQHGPTVIDLSDRDVTKSYNKLVLNEINTELRQLELDF
jgi:hypothetical protein